MRLQNVDSLTATGYPKRPLSSGEDPASVRSQLQRHRRDDPSDVSNQLWTLAMVITLFSGLGGGLYLSKGVWYEFYAVTHPFYDTPVGESATNELSQILDQRIFGDTKAEPQNVEAVAAKLPEAPLEDTALPTPEKVEGNGDEEEAGVRDTELEAQPGFTEEEGDQSATMAPGSATQESQGDGEKEPSETEQPEEPPVEVTPPAVTPPEVTASSPCTQYKEGMKQLTLDVQADIYKLQHPQDCSAVPLLECDSSKGMDQGTGSRLFFLTRCLAKCVELRRTCVLNPNMPGTTQMLSPFEPWSNCTMADVQKARNAGRGRHMVYEPKSMPDMAVIEGIKGGLVPKQYAKRGYFWWKAQEMLYALRPTPSTVRALQEHKRAIGWPADGTRVHGMQVRRTDKVEGKLKEAEKVPVDQYAEKLVMMAETRLKPNDQVPVKTVLLATDDPKIQAEAKEAEKKYGLQFLKILPAPKRKIGNFKGRELKDALDILVLADTEVLVFTYSSGFGALAFLLKLAREGYCTSWYSMDQGKREWPRWAGYGNGGYTGVPKGSRWASDLCQVKYMDNAFEEDPKYHCNLEVSLNGASRVLSSYCKC
mmetsp:Transcript_21590/g.47393  ORF Transcript_21590/g.47393 Transcript_21590/m.47393 type:complete len:593 (-) Transcript_21590:346-2124(-)